MTDDYGTSEEYNNGMGEAAAAAAWSGDDQAPIVWTQNAQENNDLYRQDSAELQPIDEEHNALSSEESAGLENIFGNLDGSFDY